MCEPESLAIPHGEALAGLMSVHGKWRGSISACFSPQDGDAVVIVPYRIGIVFTTRAEEFREGSGLFGPGVREEVCSALGMMEPDPEAKETHAVDPREPNS